MNRWLQKQWGTFTFWHILLMPLSWIFLAATYIRKSLYGIDWIKRSRLSVPVIVVGNISVGGTGKTPFVIWLAEQLKLAGYRPGIISRGYGGTFQHALAVFANSNPQLVGDEPVLIAKRTDCPVFVGVNRVLAGRALLQANPLCNVIISDDGLQHYALQRDVEIALVDSTQQFGNRCLLPAGPLRESVSRLQSVDAIVVCGSDEMTDLPVALGSTFFSMQLQGNMLQSLNDERISQLPSNFFGKNLVAIAGIGNPERFFNQLTALGLQFEFKAFADHYAFSAQDLAQFSDQTILMTEKDAVKCRRLITADAWFLPVMATLSSKNKTPLITLILQKLRS